MSRGPDAAMLLERRLRITAEAAGVVMTIVAAEWVGWASATFNGARHRMTIRGAGERFDRWVAMLPEANLPLRGHLVADLTVAGRHATADGVAIDLEVLTVEER